MYFGRYKNLPLMEREKMSEVEESSSFGNASGIVI